MERRAGRPAWQRYGVAVVLAAIATAIAAGLQPLLTPTPLAPFYGAVALAAWYGGLRPALLTVVLSVVGISTWVFAPAGVWALNWSQLSRLGTFAIVSLLIALLSASRDRAEAALRASERRFRTMLETANEGVWLVDRNARTQYVNDRMAALLGTTPDRVGAGSVADFVFPEDLPAMRERIANNLAGRTEEFDFRFRRADGTEILVLAGTSPVRNDAGRVAGALGLFTDVTARRRAEAALAQANERFTLAAAAVQALIYEWDLATGRVERSSGIVPLLGLQPHDVSATQAGWRARIHPDDLARIVADSEQRVADDDRYSREYRVRHRDGHWVTVWDQGQLVRDGAGRAVRVIGSVIDVTGWKDAEDALRLLADASRVLASSLDYEDTVQRVAWLAVPSLADWCVVDLRDERGVAQRVAVAHADPGEADLAARLMGYTAAANGDGPEEQVMRTGRALLIERVDDDAIRTAAQSDEHLTLLRAFGVHSAIVAPLRAGGEVLGAMALATTAVSGRRLNRDDLALAEELAHRAAMAITSARLYRDAHAAEARYRGLFEGTKDGILVFTADGTCVDANPALAAMAGYSRGELAGAAATLIARGGPWSGEERERLRRDGQWRGDFALRRKDGATVPVESWITRVQLPTGPAYVGVLRDISERKRFEQLQEEFLSALAHDLKNPLTTVRGQTQLLKRRIARGQFLEPSRLESALDGIDAATVRMTRLLDEMGDITRLRAGQEIDLNRADTDLVALARRTIDEHARISERHAIRLDSEVEALSGFWDGPRLERVLGNLLGNAVKYSPDGGEITVWIARDVCGDAKFAVLSVRDRGVGIPAADLGFVFERFRRAGNVESFAGSGIGLAGAKRIVELHGGTIGVESTEGEGSTFTVRLPIEDGVGTVAV